MTTYTSAVEISHLRKTYGNLVAVNDVRRRWPREKSSASWDRTGRGKPPPSNAPWGSGARTPARSGCSAWTRTPTATRSTRSSSSSSRRPPSRPSCGSARSWTCTAPSTAWPADVSELVEALGLGGKLRDYYRSLSGGQRQRLSVALALIGLPKIAVLDEMTTGLDPQARRDTWELIEHIRDRGTTILLVARCRGRGRTAVRSRGPHRPRPHRGAEHPGRAHRPGQGRQATGGSCRPRRSTSGC